MHFPNNVNTDMQTSDSKIKKKKKKNCRWWTYPLGSGPPCCLDDYLAHRDSSLSSRTSYGSQTWARKMATAVQQTRTSSYITQSNVRALKKVTCNKPYSWSKIQSCGYNTSNYIFNILCVGGEELDSSTKKALISWNHYVVWFSSVIEQGHIH